MISLKRVLSLAAAFAVLCLHPVAARADNFNLALTGPGGTVDFEIIGLTNNTTGPAPEVLITSYPASLNSIFPAGPINATAWNNLLENEFTETDGVLSSVLFYKMDDPNPGLPEGWLELEGNSGFIYLNIEGPSISGTVSVIPPVSATPEPSSLIMLATGLAGATGVARRKLRG